MDVLVTGDGDIPRGRGSGEVPGRLPTGVLGVAPGPLASTHAGTEGTHCSERTDGRDGAHPVRRSRGRPGGGDDLDGESPLSLRRDTERAFRAVPRLAPAPLLDRGLQVAGSASTPSWCGPPTTPSWSIPASATTASEACRSGTTCAPTIRDGLPRAGVHPEEVDYVFCTHMHVDHVGWNTRLENGRFVPTFPNAKYLFHRTEWEHWKETEEEIQAEVVKDSLLPIVDAGLAEMVESDHVIEDGVRLQSTPRPHPGPLQLGPRPGRGGGRGHHRRPHPPPVPGGGARLAVPGVLGPRTWPYAPGASSSNATPTPRPGCSVRTSRPRPPCASRAAPPGCRVAF